MPPKIATPQACPKCHGIGYIIDATNTAVICDCGAAAKRAGRGRVATSGIPAKFMAKDFASFKATDAERRAVLKTARAYAQSFSAAEPQGILLRGITGCGKTHLAVAILREVISQGHSGAYANFTDLLTRIRATWDKNSDRTEASLLDGVDDVDLLVLDDVGAESATDWTRDRLYVIINRRYESGRATIITTNCSDDELEKRIGARTASRLAEMCPGGFPPFPQQDFRRANMF